MSSSSPRASGTTISHGTSSPHLSNGNSSSTTTTTFGYSKNVETFKRRPSFSASLREAINNPANRCVAMKRSTTGRYNKRFFVVHSHYLSYYASDPSSGSYPDPKSTLDLWAVDAVNLEDTKLTLVLSEEASEARRSEMGSRAIREGKKIIQSTSMPLANAILKRLEVTRRGLTTPKFEIKFATTSEAQAWLRKMRDSPMLGTLSSLKALTRTASGSSMPGAGKEHDEAVDIKELRFSMPNNREFIYTDVEQLLDGVSTQILLSNVSPYTIVRLHIATGVEKKVEMRGNATFNPSLKESSGYVEIPMGGPIAGRLEWQRKYESPYKMLAVFSGVFFVFMTLAVFLMGIGRFEISFITSILVAFGATFQYREKTKHVNNVYLKSVTVMLPSASPASAPLASTIAPPTEAVSFPSATKKQAHRKGHHHLGAAALQGITPSVDLNVTLEESAMLADLRARLVSFRNVDVVAADAFYKKHQKFIDSWGGDIHALKNQEKRDRVMQKHVDVDFRCVRFLRARKHNVDKAEIMVRDSLTWRIVLGSEDIINDREDEGGFKVSQWLIDYMGAPMINSMIHPLADVDARISKWWLRDREGHLTMFFRTGRNNTRKLYKKCSTNPVFLIKSAIWAVELAKQDLDRIHQTTRGKVESTLTVVVDLEGFALSEQISVGDLIPLARRFFPIFATSYPELLQRVIVIQAPWLFGSLWKALSPFIPEEVLEKIQIYSGAVELDKWIRPHIENKYIPAYLGGGLEDPSGDPFCSQRLPPVGPYLPDKGLSLLEGVDERSKKGYNPNSMD